MLKDELQNAERVELLGFLDEYEDVLGHMRAAEIFASPSTREGFGITYAEAMAADCIVIGAEHPESAAEEVIGDGGYTVYPNSDSVADALDRELAGQMPPKEPIEVAVQYDWGNIASRAENAYTAAIER